MNYTLMMVVLFAFAKANTAQAQVFIDKVNAPKNPVGAYWSNLAAKEAKGLVYSIDFTEFPRDGKQVFTQSTMSLEQAIKDKRSYTELKNGLVVKQKLHYDNYVKTYTYNAQNSIVREESDLWLTVYKYDEKNRLIEEEKTDKTKKITDKVTFSYETANGQLIVTSTYYSSDGQRGSVVTEYFKEGLNILKTSNGKTLMRSTYTFDERGNWVKQTTSSTYGDYELERYIIYYDDLDLGIKNKQFAWQRLPYTTGATVGFPVLLFSNSKPPAYAMQVKKFLAARTLDNGALFYINLSNRYYYGKDAFKDRENIGLKGQAVEIAAGSEALVETYGGYIKLYDSGINLKKIKHYKLENAYYLTDSLSQNHYVVYDYDDTNKKQFHAAKKFPEGSMFYTQVKGENTHRLFQNGELLDYSKIGNWKWTQDGTPVAIYNNLPCMVLTGSNANKETGIYVAQAYKGEKLVDKDPTATASNMTDVKPMAFNPALPLQAIKTGEFNFSFYQNGALVERPGYFVRVIEDKDLLLGYGLEDFVIVDYPSIALGATVNVTKVARENEVIVMYLNGKASYFYNSGEILKKADYKLTAINNKQWLVYFTAFRKSIIVDIVKPQAKRFESYYTYSNNDWLCKVPGGGASLFSQGTRYSTSSYAIKTQGNDAFIYVNGKLTFYLANYTTAPVNKMMALTRYK